MTDDARRIVEQGYDTVAERYLEWSGGPPSGGRAWALGTVKAALSHGAEVLDLGCGAGEPVSRVLAERCRVTGVDISARQVEIARRLVPAATFRHADMTNVEFDPGSFDAVVAFYALIHVPRDEQAALLGRIAGWLRPNGFLFATLGVGDDPGTVEEDWLGSPMFFSHFDAQGNRAMVAAAGLTVEIAEVRNEEEHGEPVPFLWVLARKPVTPPRASRPSRTPHGPEGGR